jgi:mono/diheme cytochrome c family protein
MRFKKQTLVICIITLLAFASIAAINSSNEPFKEGVYIEPSLQKPGDIQKGYDYLVNGDYLKSGLGYKYYVLLNGKDRKNYLGRTGKAANVAYSFNLIKTKNYKNLVVPNCLQCHGQQFNGKLIIGLGNTFLDFSKPFKRNDVKGKIARQIMQLVSPSQYQSAKVLIRSFSTIAPYLTTETQGVNAADRLAILLVAHRNPETLEWSDTPLLDIPAEVIPTDVPAWWLLKKKNAMFYNGFGRGDFGKFLMLSNLLTVSDSSEAAETFTHFGDVLAYIKSIEPPKFPSAVNDALASRGRLLFNNNCSKCHGTYGENAQYPNLLIPANIIKTDSLLFKANYQNPQFIEWFNKSWYAKGDHPARLQPFNGYIAPPLDGIWVTAPYLHNGSVPTLDALLNSKERPQYWQRNFKNPEYDYEKVGWKYEVKTEADNRKIYNTDKPGYRNIGHTFGDRLSNDDRRAVIEYLKSL